MAQLVAKSSILLGNRMYKAGDELPANDPFMVDAWLKAGTAEKRIDSENLNDLTAFDLKYDEDMKIDFLREEGKTFGLTFPVGTKKSEMAATLNAAYSEKLAAEESAKSVGGDAV